MRSSEGVVPGDAAVSSLGFASALFASSSVIDDEFDSVIIAYVPGDLVRSLKVGCTALDGTPDGAGIHTPDFVMHRSRVFVFGVYPTGSLKGDAGIPACPQDTRNSATWCCGSQNGHALGSSPRLDVRGH